MKCGKSERLICLYNELDSDERLALDRHLATCETCRMLFDNVQKDQRSTQHLLTPPFSVNTQLTDRIMNEVIASKRKMGTSRLNFFPVLSGYRLSRIALAALSFFLVAGFIIELNRPIMRDVPYSLHYSDASLKSVELNSKVFYNRSDSITTRSFLKSLADCISLCKENLIPDACEDCQTRLKKLRTTYANN